MEFSLVLSGLLGIGLTLSIWSFHDARAKAIRRAADKWKKQPQDAEQTPPRDSSKAANGLSGTREE